jgi:hypothetical protein
MGRVCKNSFFLYTKKEPNKTHTRFSQEEPRDLERVGGVRCERVGAEGCNNTILLREKGKKKERGAEEAFVNFCTKQGTNQHTHMGKPLISLGSCQALVSFWGRVPDPDPQGPRLG